MVLKGTSTKLVFLILSLPPNGLTAASSRQMSTGGPTAASLIQYLSPCRNYVVTFIL